MKILYAVQGTGNGHISRASAMAKAFRAYRDIQVTWLFSGREAQGPFGDFETYQWRQGLSFVAESGRIKPLRTLRQADFKKFFIDVRQMDLSQYDVVISDFEPVVAHAGKAQGVPVIGIGHQYAFNYPIPMKGHNPISQQIFRHFAPATINIGLHWHHFDLPLLPPIVDLDKAAIPPESISNKVTVYLPFEDPATIQKILSPLREYEFYIYHPRLDNRDAGNLHARAISVSGFKRDLLTSEKVICNTGFELIAESLQLGKAILTKPLRGQVEQLSNARALEELEYATVLTRLGTDQIGQWLDQSGVKVRIDYPDVAETLVGWIADGCEDEVENLSRRLWQRTNIECCSHAHAQIPPLYAQRRFVST